MGEIVDLVVNNGIGIACVCYLIHFQSTTMKEMLKTLEGINTRLSIIESHMGCEDK